MKITKCLVSDIEKTNQKSKMSSEVCNSYEGFVEQHFVILSEYCPNKDHLVDKIHHICLLIDEVRDIIVGFRYFYFPTKQNHCELFAIFVDPNYREQGFANNMIQKSIKYSNMHNKFSFIVRIAGSSDEQAGLLSSYEKLCPKLCPPNKFTIYSYKGEKKYGL